MKGLIAVLMVVGFVRTGLAQERAFTLDSCIRYALTHRTEITISEQTGRVVNRTVGYLRQQQLPDVNASYGHSMNWGRSLNMETYEWEDSRNQYGKMLNQQLAQAKLLSDIRNEIEQMCLEAEIRKQNYEALREQETNYREILSLRRIQYEQGKLSVYDLLTAESNWRNVRAELLLERYNLNCYLEMLDFYKTGGRKGAY